jgi:peptide/nickel transport system ATP-binding protein
MIRLVEQVLVIENLKKYFKTDMGLVKAVDGVSFSINPGETFGLVGESGSGKSTTAYTIMGIYAPNDGKILFKGKEVSLTRVTKRPLSVKKEMQMVFQDPGSSLNPRQSIKQILELPLKVHNIVNKNYEDKIIDLLGRVELPSSYMDRYPPEIGGGEKQMVAIARAIATEPSLIMLDEPTSALDVSMQGKIINMLMRLQKEFNYSYLFITHDLSLMRNVANRVGIMYLGKLNEVASASEFFEKPLHPYTQMLLSSIPVVTDEEEKIKQVKVVSKGEIPSPVNVPSGCVFHPRCNECQEICKNKEPEMVEVKPGHFVRCNKFLS